MRIAMIEVGHWHAKIHLKSFQMAEDVEIVAVSDRQPGVAETFAKISGGQPFQDYQEMLEAVRPEFVVALGRHADMPAIAKTLLEINIPFAIEKPIGTSAADVAPLVELAKERNTFVAVPFTNRYSAMWSQLDKLEQAGRVGLRSHFHYRVINGPPHRYELDGVGWMLDPAISGGGCMRNLGIHAADAFLRFTQGEAVEVLSAAITYRVHGAAIEEMGAALLRSESGIIGTVEAGYSFASMSQGDFEGRLSTENCYIIDHNHSLQVATLDDDQVQALSIPGQGARYDQFGVDILERLHAGRPPVASLEDCYRAMQIIDEIYKKAVHTPYAHNEIRRKEAH